MKFPLVLLHGAIGSKQQFNELLELLSKKMEVYALDFPGHGKAAFPGEPFSIPQFAAHVLQWMDKKKLLKVDVFGYSMGGFVGIYLATHFPERVNSVFTLATKFNWSKEIALRETSLLNPAVIEQKLPDFAKELRQRHAPKDWKELMNKTSEMLIAMGRKNPLHDEDLKNINQEVLIGMGDRDNMVIIEESVYAYRLLKNGRLLILPNTPHPLEKVSVDRLKTEVLTFFGT